MRRLDIEELPQALRSFAESGKLHRAFNVPNLTEAEESIVWAIVRAGLQTVRDSGDDAVTKVETIDTMFDLGDFSKSHVEFLSHADGAYYLRRPRWMLLYCVRAAPGGITYVVNGSAVIRALEKRFDPDFLEALQVMCIERGNLTYRHPLIEKIGRKKCLHWTNGMFLWPDVVTLSTVSRKNLTRLLGELYAFARETMEKNVVYRHEWRPHDFLLINNLRALHGRTEVLGDNPQRLLLRALFDKTGFDKTRAPVRIEIVE